MTNQKIPRKYFLMCFVFAFSISTIQCSKTNIDPSGLPPETQTGAGIFACKINGVVWKYKNPNYEFLSTKPKTSWSYDPSFFGGAFEIDGVRYLDGQNETDLLTLFSDSISTYSEKIIEGKSRKFGLRYHDYTTKNYLCEDISSGLLVDSTNFFSAGKLVITKFDKNTKIVSGTFYCTIKQNGCDTLKITEGRFDVKY